MQTVMHKSYVLLPTVQEREKKKKGKSKARLCLLLKNKKCNSDLQSHLLQNPTLPTSSTGPR